MECLPILQIPSFDCFFSIGIYFSIGLGVLFGAGALLKS